MPKAGTHARIHCLIVSLCLAGCSQSGSTREDSPPREDSKTDAAAARREAQERCQQPQIEADELLAEAQACTTDSDCSLAQNIDAPCLHGFLCPVSVAQTADLDRLRSEAQQLSTEFRECTSQCAVADCGSVVGAPSVCDSTTNRCRVKSGRTAEAGASAQRD